MSMEDSRATVKELREATTDLDVDDNDLKSRVYKAAQTITQQLDELVSAVEERKALEMVNGAKAISAAIDDMQAACREVGKQTSKAEVGDELVSASVAAKTAAVQLKILMAVLAAGGPATSDSAASDASNLSKLQRNLKAIADAVVKVISSDRAFADTSLSWNTVSWSSTS